ncbi:hypothetical protein CFP56_000617 [Quercus suber]|uniref:Uncharacterized protein n=1 Tax=Quercus suber TaxID=58331 RepID=A0AAW0IP41_QUESU
MAMLGMFELEEMMAMLGIEWSEPRRLLDMSVVHTPQSIHFSLERTETTFQIFNLPPNIVVSDLPHFQPAT